MNPIIQYSRERNRVHARNTRERKKIQLDLLQMRIQELIDDVSTLKSSYFLSFTLNS